MWIEWEKGLPAKPEIGKIAKAMGVTRLHAAAACMEVWSWAEDQTETGHIATSPDEISESVRIPGIGEAMLDAGWLIQLDDGISIPNFERHNGMPAKRRALKMLRMRITRAERREQLLTQTDNKTGTF